MSTAIATVVAVIGEVQVRTPQGIARTLKPGDVIQEGDSIITAPNGRVELQLIDGRTLTIEPGQIVAITAELTETTRPQRQEAELGSATLERVLAGENSDQSGSPSATPQSDGLSAAGESNDGNSFVRLLRVQERIDPLNFEYATARADTHNPFDGGIGTLDSGDVEAGEASDGYSFVRLPRIQEPTAPLSYEYGTTRPVILNPYNGGGGETRILNQAPEAVADSNTTPEDTPLIVPASTGLLANDKDPDGGTLSVTGFSVAGLANDFTAGQTATLPGIGSLQINSDGSYSFTPVADFNGQIPVVTYEISDGQGGEDTATLSLVVTPVADIVADSISTDEDTAVTTSVLTNDSFEGTPVISSVTQGTHGTVVNNGDGTLTYTPVPDYNGPDSYTYTVTSPAGVTETATVYVTVNPVVDIADDTISTDEDTAVTTSVLTNDSFEGTPTVTAVTQGTHGTVAINPDNTITYTPNPDYNGPDSYTYTVTSPTGVTETATVNVTVNPVVDIADDTISTDEDTAVTTSVLTNDSFEGTPVISSVTQGTHGTVVNNGDGTLTYTPNPDYNGPDSYTYTVTSPTGVTETATVNITVNPVIDIADDTISTNEDTAVTTSVLTNDSFEGTPVISSVTQGTHGTVVNNGDGTLTYTPNPDFNGTDSYTYTVTSPTGVTETATVNVTINPVVDIADDTISTDEDTAVTTSVLTNDSFEGTPTVTAVTQGAHGTVAINPDNTITYTPNPDYNGPDSYTYTVTSPAGVTETATVYVTVNPVVDITDDTISTDEDTPVTTSVLTNDSFEGTPTVTAVTQGTHGTVAINPDNTITYTPNPDYNGPDSYTYTVTSPTGVTETATVYVTVNPVVDITDDTISTDEDTPVTTSVLTNDSFEGTPTVTAVTQGTHGTVAINPDNTITYTPNPDYNGPDSYTYTVTSPTGVTETATVNITVNPVIDNADDTISTDEDTPVTTSVLTNDSFEGTPTVTAVTQGTHGTVAINPDNTITYTPNPDYNGPDSYTYTVTSPAGVTETATVNVTINPVVDIADDTISTDEDTSVTTSVLTNDSFEGTPVISSVTQGTHGTVVNNGDGTLTYTPNPDFNGTDSYTYTVTSPTGVTETATVNVTINPVVDIADDTISTDEDTSVTTSVLTNDSFEGTPVISSVTQGTHGTVVNNGDGTLTYTPVPDYNGPDSYTYTVTSPAGVTETATVYVTVNPVVDIADDTISTDEDTAVTTSVLTNDSFEGTPTVTAVTQGTHGTVAINPDNTITYTPNPDYNGPDSYTYTVTSPAGVTETATVYVTVNPVVDITDDTISTDEDTPVTTSVLTNDSFEGTPTVTAVTQGTHGTVAINPDNTITYTPNPDYNGPDSYTYTVTSPTGVTETATVNITVNPVIDIADDTISTNEDTAVTTSVLTNDSFEGTPVISSVTQGTHGTVVNNGDGTLTYTPNPDFNGTDSYTYTVTSPTGVTETATVNVTINPVVDIADDTISTDEDTSVTTSVLTNDSFEGTPTVTAITQGTHGTVAINPDNTITYTPNPDYNGPDSYTYTVTSPAGVTETATVNVTINPVVDIADDTISTDEDTSVTTSVLTNDSFEGTPTVTAVTQGTHGTVAINPDNTITYTPNPDYNGPDSYTYTVTSPTGVTETATVNVTINPVVDIADDTISTDEDTPVTTSVLTNDSFEGTPTVTAVTQGTHGTVAINPDNTITYTPNPDYNGPDSYTYTVTSPAGVTETATVNVTINPVVDIADDTISTDEDTSVTTSVLTNDSFEGTPVISSVTQGTHGTVVNNGDGTLTYTPNPDFNGTDSYTYTVTSPAGVTETATVNVTINPVVDIADDTISTDEDTSVTTSVLTNDSFEGTPVISSVTQGTHGTVVNNGDGTLTYTPNPDFNGTDSYTYTVTSPTGVTETATVNVTINPVVDIADDTISTDEDTAVTTSVLTNDSFEGTPTVTAVTQGAHGTVAINPDNTITYTPNPDYNGPDSYTYTVTSPAGVTETATVYVTVNPVVDITDDTISTDEDTPVTTSVLTNDSFEGTPTVTAVTQGTHGTVAINPDNTITYTPNPDYNGPDSYTYTVTSPTGVTETATVNITVNPVIDIADDTISTNEDTAVTTSVLTNDSFEGTPVISSVTQGTHGTVVNNGDGTLTYTPNPDFNGTDSYTYTVTSPTGVTETATVNITVNPVIDIADDTISTDEDTSVTTSVLTNDSFEGTPVISSVTQGTHGTVVNNGDGTLTYTPVPDYNGPDSYTYTVTSPAGVTETATVYVTVNPVVDIADDAEVTGKNTLVNIDVDANDSFESPGHVITAINGSPIAVNGSVNVDNGVVTLKPDGTLDFSPSVNFTGPTSFSYTVTSGGPSETATVNINVLGVDIKDDSGNDDMLSSIDTLTTTVLSGRIPAGGTLTSLVVSDGVGTVSVDPNTVTINLDGTFSTTFDATGLSDGTLTVTLNAQDADGHSAATTDTILKDTVTPVSIDPLDVTNNVTPAPITGTGEVGASIVVKADGVTLGTVTVSAGGTWSYTPVAPLGNTVNEITADATDLYGNTATTTRAVPTLEITDGNGGSPGHATVDEAALAAGSNAAATTESATGSFTLGVSPDTLTSIRVGGTDISATSLSDSGITPITIATTYGQIVINGFDSGTGVVDYRYDLLSDQTHPAGSGALTDAIAIRVVDSNGDIRHDTLNVDIVDDVPTPADDPAMTLAEGGIVITQASPGAANLLANDTQGADGARVYDFTYKNVGGDDTTATVLSGGSSTVAAQFGSLTVFSNGNWSFTSSAAINHATDGSSEDASFSYRLIDGDGDISTTSAIQPISVTDTLPSIGTPDSDSVSEASLSAGSNPNAGALTQTGSLAVTKAADSIDTQFDATQTALNALNLTSGGVGLVYVISPDGHTLTATKGGGGATLFTVSITNPTASSAGYSFVLAGAIDHGGDISKVLSFAFNVTDADIDVISSQFNITVLDDSSSTQAHTINEDSAQQTWNTQADASSSNTTITAAASHGTASINASGKLLYTPDAHYSGSDTLTYQIDENGNVTSTTVNITVNPISDAPTLTRDAASVITPEDTAVALGLNAPSVTDATDQNGGAAGDNPERLSLITLTGIPNGVQLLDGDGGDALLFTSTGAAITVLLSDAGNLVASPGAATLTMTTAQFEALKVNPVAHSATNFTVTMSVTEFEVDDANAPLVGVAGATSTTTVAVDVRAVTDPVDLKINGSDVSHDATIDEDTSFDLGALLSATFSDLDGSETRFIDLAGLPAGSLVNGVTVGAGGTASVQLVGNNTLPSISLTPPPDFSGDIGGITVTLRALDIDSDSPAATPATVTDAVTLNLYVNPIADDISAPDVATPEDTAVLFMQNLAVTDTGSGTEAITGISVMVLPTGWVIKNHLGAVVHTGDGATDFTLPGADVTSLDYQNYTLTPPAHSSTDISLTLSITSSDTNTVNGAPVVSNVTADHLIDITVTPVAELIGGDSDGNALADLTMNGNFNYTTPGLEDNWFGLNMDGFDFKTPWSNEDTNEQTFALLTPSLGGSTAAAIGSQFKYTDGGGVHELTYVGAPVEIPIAWLHTVEFKAAANIAGMFSIGIQAKTIDTDPDTSATVTATSGAATLTNLAIHPVADNVTLSVVSPATGSEDTALPLVIRPTSADPSETFNVTIRNIPAGTVSLVYDDVAQPITWDGGTGLGSVTIVNFDKTKTLTITPPPNSNTDFVLSVDAVSVDTAAGLPTSTSAATTLPISVDILGVADPAVIDTTTPVNTEAAVDAAAGQIALSSLITSAALGDTDGSEGLTLKLTGLDAQFDITGANYLLGAGSSRVWVLTPAELASAKLVVPANFSGTVNLSLIPITTENDGNSLTGAPIALSTTITPSPEATLNTSTTLNEDTLAQVSFALQPQNGDGDETLASVWITAADVDANPNFTLYFGNGTATTLAAAAGSEPGVVLDAGMYKLTGAAFNNIYVKGADNLSGSANFGIQYEVTDPSSDASLAAVTTQTAANYNLVINPVTDATAAAITGITASNAANAGVAGTIVTATGTTSLDVVVAITKLNDVNANNTPDTDGSETLIQLIIDGVPQGVTVVGATYIGNSTAGGNTGQWLLSVADTFNSATLNQTVTFDLDGTAGQLGDLNQLISINAVTQDGAAATVAANVSWILQTAPAGTFDDSTAVPQVPATIDTWNVVLLPANVALEDTSLNLNDLIDAQIANNGPFSITLTNVPAGATVTGMTSTTVGGETIWTASATGGNAALQALLDGISITPPANLNSNNASNLAFNATLTTYAAGGARTDATFAVSQPITPASDAAVVTVSAPNANEGDAVAFTVQVANPADAGFAGLVDGKLYLKLDSSGLNPASGGSLSDAGGAIVTTLVSGIAGVPDDDYYVITGVSVGDTLNFTYTPDTHASGAVSLTAYVQSQEANAGNVIASSGTDSFSIAPVNSGYNLAANHASGAEDSRIQLDITAAGLVDGDGSESVLGATLKNVPNGYLVYVGADAGAATLATNAGGDGFNNIWAIPATGGVLPAYIAILPPPNASGTVTGLQLSVLTQETGLTPTETSVSFNLIVAGVADGITLTPTLSFGVEGDIIPLNLNASMLDTDGSETATLTINGLGQYAAFFANGTPISASYDSGTDTYTLAGISHTDVNNLGFLQAARSGTLNISAFTSDGASTSVPVNATLDIAVSDKLATTGNDTLLYDGNPLNGLAGVDVVQLRLGENLDFATNPVKPSNIETLDLMPAGQDHSLTNLTLQDVLNMTDSGKTLSILGDDGDSVSLQNGNGLDVWSKGGSVTESGHTFDVYTNTLDPAVQVKIEQAINDSIV
jgi:large repetitive protein